MRTDWCTWDKESQRYYCQDSDGGLRQVVGIGIGMDFEQVSQAPTLQAWALAAAGGGLIGLGAL